MGKRRCGFTLVELMISVAILALLLGVGMMSMKKARGQAETRGLAEVVAEELRLARQKAIAEQVPVAVGFPTSNGAAGHCQSLYLLEGEEIPRVTRVANFQGEFPHSYLMVPVYNATGVTVDATPPVSRSNADLWNATGWVPATKDYLLIFTPSGAVRSNGAPHYDGEFRVLVSQGIQESGTAAPGGAPAGMQYFKPDVVSAPFTVGLSAAGAVRVAPAIPDVAAGAVTIQSDGVATGAGAPAAVVASAPNNNPAFQQVLLYPKPNDYPGARTTTAVLEPGEHLTMRVEATDPDGDPLFCEWVEDNANGSFSSATQDRMEWDADVGAWVSVWEWSPPSGAAGPFSLTCTVRDGRGGVVQTSPGTETVAMGTGERIYFDGVVDVTWDTEIGRVSVDGTGTEILKNPDDGRPVAWSVVSPDGSRVAYQVYTTVDYGVWIMNADGSGKRQVTNWFENTGESFQFTPDGTGLVFEGWPYTGWQPPGQLPAGAFALDLAGNPVRFDPMNLGNGGGSDVFAMYVDGSQLRCLPCNTPAGESMLLHHLSKDGNHVVFDSGVDVSDRRPLVYDYETSNPTVRVGPVGLECYREVWHPDNTRFALVRTDVGNRGIWLMDKSDTDGSTLVPLALGNYNFPSWSPDGSALMVQSAGNPLWNIAMIKIDGTVVDLSSPKWEGYGSWSNSGFGLFCSNRDDSWTSLYRVNPDGSNQVRLTFDGVHATHLAR